MTCAILPELVALAAIILFPGWVARGLTVAILWFSETARWWQVSVLSSAIAAVCSVIYRDAVRLHYAEHLARLWADWF